MIQKSSKPSATHFHEPWKNTTLCPVQSRYLFALRAKLAATVARPSITGRTMTSSTTVKVENLWQVKKSLLEPKVGS